MPVFTKLHIPVLHAGIILIAGVLKRDGKVFKNSPGIQYHRRVNYILADEERFTCNRLQLLF